MKKLASLTLFMAVFLFGSLSACAQPDATSDDPIAVRKAKILDNLKLAFPQLQQYDIEITELAPSSIDGLDEGGFLINRSQLQKFLVTNDDTKLYLLSADPIDVSKSSEEIAALMAEQKAAEAAEALARKTELMAFAAGSPVRGNPDAPITIIEFSDFQCPYCARGFTTVEQLLEKYPDDINFIYLHFPLNNHPWAKPASIAAICTANQDHDVFWSLHDTYFQNQSQFNPANVLEKTKTFLADKGLDMATWSTCAEDAESETYKAADALVNNSLATGQRFGVSGTPGFFVNGHFLSGAKPIAEFEALIQDVKAGSE